MGERKKKRQRKRHCRCVPKLQDSGRQTRLLEFTAVGNHNLLGGLAALRAITFNFLHHIHAFNDRAKYNVLAIQPSGLGGAEEELRAVGVRTSVGHGQNTRTSVLQGKVLVSKLGTIDGLAASAVVVGKVAALAHEVRDNAVEGAALVAESLLASAQSTEVLSRLGYNVASQFHDDAAQRLAISSHIKEDFGFGHFLDFESKTREALL